MSRHYKAITNHTPLDYGTDLDQIDSHFDGMEPEFIELFRRWKLPPLELDDCQSLIEQIKRLQVDFALACDAIPMRTLRQFSATVTRIAKSPEEFLADVGRWDPEATARVYAAFAQGSRENRLLLERFEAGEGPPPTTEAIAKAASEVRDELARQMANASQVGGQSLALRRDFILNLAAIFVKFGGSLKRSTRYDAQARHLYTYHGAFNDFLELVLPPVMSFARKAGFRMDSIRSLADIPRQGGNDVCTVRIPIFGIQPNFGPERSPARVGNFFKLHARRAANHNRELPVL